MRIKIGLVALALVSGATNVRSQVFEPGKEPRTVRTEGFWENWFVQMGLDMTLQNPYGCNFGKVIPKGMTFGLNGALGKWFTPEYGLRGRVQWENGLIPNNSVEWVPPVKDPKQNYKKGGLATIAIDGRRTGGDVPTE